MKEFFLVFEGADKIGKSTLIKRVFEEINNKAKNLAILQTRQPKIKLISPDHQNSSLSAIYDDSMAQTLFFLLDRKINLNWMKKWSEENFEKNRIILCDRYFYSTFAYQGNQEQKNIKKIISLHELTDTWRVPDCAFFLKGDKKIFQDRYISSMKKNFSTFLKRDKKKYFSFKCICCQNEFLAVIGRVQNKQRKNLVSDCVLNLFPKGGDYDFLEIDGFNSPLKMQEKYEKIFSFFKEKHAHNIFTIQMKKDIEKNVKEVVKKIEEVCDFQKIF